LDSSPSSDRTPASITSSVFRTVITNTGDPKLSSTDSTFREIPDLETTLKNSLHYF
jgi:hypothetical protein